MLNPRAVAVVGASPREGSPGRQMVHQLRLGGWDGEVYPVNPRYDDVLGLRCYPSLMEVPSAPELVLLGVPNAALEEQLGAAARARARGAVIFASAHQDAPLAERPSLAERLRAIAREAGVVAVFLETVRDPGAFRGSLAAAADRDVSVVALKVGREEATWDLVEVRS